MSADSGAQPISQGDVIVLFLPASWVCQHQLSEAVGLGTPMENLLPASPIPLLLSFGAWYLRRSLIRHSFLFLEPSCFSFTPLSFFLCSANHLDACIALKQSSHCFLHSKACCLLLKIIHAPTVLGSRDVKGKGWGMFNKNISYTVYWPGVIQQMLHPQLCLNYSLSKQYKLHTSSYPTQKINRTCKIYGPGTRSHTKNTDFSFA